MSRQAAWLDVESAEVRYICTLFVCLDTHTHTHTHIYMKTCVCYAHIQMHIHMSAYICHYMNVYNVNNLPN